jgi:hypothetical protein
MLTALLPICLLATLLASWTADCVSLGSVIAGCSLGFMVAAALFTICLLAAPLCLASLFYWLSSWLLLSSLAGRFFDSSCCHLCTVTDFSLASVILLVDLFTFFSSLAALFASVSLLAALFFSVSLLAALFAHVSLLAALLVLRALLSKIQEFDETFLSAGVAGFTVM